MMTIITMVLPFNDDDNNDRDVTSDKCGVFFPLLSHHDGTVRPTILRTYGGNGDDDGGDITKKILIRYIDVDDDEEDFGSGDDER